jgi:hypothetical protein
MIPRERRRFGRALGLLVGHRRSLACLLMEVKLGARAATLFVASCARPRCGNVVVVCGGDEVGSAPQLARVFVSLRRLRLAVRAAGVLLSLW